MRLNSGILLTFLKTLFHYLKLWECDVENMNSEIMKRRRKFQNDLINNLREIREDNISVQWEDDAIEKEYSATKKDFFKIKKYDSISHQKTPPKINECRVPMVKCP